MSALGDTIYVISILVPLLGLIVRNYLFNLLAFVLGTIGFLVFTQNYTGITFSASNLYLALIPLFFGLVNLAFFFNWLREERI